MMRWNVAQVNVARLRAGIDDPIVAGFVAGLEPINRLADASAGFVWRLQTDDGDATDVRVFDDELVIINMSVWESIDALADFVYRSAHTEFLRSKRAWFERMVEAQTALWWIEAGRLPSVAEGVVRLETLRAVGPSPDAFTFRNPFAAPGLAAVEVDDRNACPA